ncbi:copper homeostasis protein CutC [Nocardioides speluncae]|uniref:copper homeostasis protein CutC n=1 Tax=Nocardioides speluncae TaxID=2670337 RepID=UPI000D689A77|nr:copper homeostasis protein CutC [Nocardioides speluncae]
MTDAGVLEVTVHHVRDVAGAEEGGADRLCYLVGDDPVGMSPSPSDVAALVRETELPVRVMLRLNDSWTTTGAEFARLVTLAEQYVGIGAEGVVFGFLDRDLEVDTETCTMLSKALPHVPWTFHAAFDAALEPARAWRAAVGLPGLTAVRSAGSPRGLDSGYDDLLALAQSGPEIARLLMPGGGLRAEQVPWFARAGVRQFQVDVQTRPSGSLKAYVDAGHVRSWRLLVDDAVGRVI